jgi:serine/threonine protein kinase
MPTGSQQGNAQTEGSVPAKMKARMGGRLQPLRIPKREMSYTLAVNASGLSAFSYSARGPDGALTEHVLAESGDKGFSLGALDIGPELGHGQGGRVRLSRHRRTYACYAVKVVNIVNEQTRHQVKRELGVYSSFEGNHPNIVALHDAFYTDGRVYMVLELMTWGSLELALLKSRDKYLLSLKSKRTEGPAGPATRKPGSHDSAGNESSVPAVSAPRLKQAGGRRAWAMEEAVLVGAASKILRALRFLHKEHAVVHRDIKPDNVMLSRDGSVKLSDFGVSLRGLELESAVQAGTLGYMSPERLEGKICTARGDIWSFGIMLLECAKGRHPLIHDSWRVEGEEIDGEEEIQRVKSAENPAHWTQCDVQAKVVELCSIPNPAHGLAYSREFESLIGQCLRRDEVPNAT